MLSESMRTAMKAQGYEPKLKPAPKRIIICCDGTWQSAVSGERNMPSNVTRLARDLEKVAVDEDGKTWQQIVWYDSGVGTTSGFLGVKYEGAIGAGLEGNVIEAYNFVSLNYNEGDKIYCFGFSRGAYTARTIAGLIADIGICGPERLHNFHEIWAAYKANDTGGRFYGSQGYWDYFDGTATDPQPDGSVRTPGHYNWTFYDVDIEVVGVFDTVGAIGMPSLHGYKVRMPFGPDKTGFHNVRLNRSIRRAFHALALDEHREAFTPTLWYLPEQKVSTAEQVDNQTAKVEELRQKWYEIMQDAAIPTKTRRATLHEWQQAKTELVTLTDRRKPPSQLKQVWFPGVHINAGGGSSDSLDGAGDMEELSTIAFAWLVDQIRPYIAIGISQFNDELAARSQLVYEVNEKIEREKEHIEAEKEAAKHASLFQRFGRLASSTTQAIMHPINAYYGPDLRMRKFDWGTGEIIDSYTLMYRVGNGEKLRTPGAYEKDPKTKDSGQTFEEIHPTVWYRMKSTEHADEKSKYYPAGMKNVKRTGNAKSGYKYAFGEKVLPLPEYKMQDASDENSFERAVIRSSGEAAQEYVAGLDQGK